MCSTYQATGTVRVSFIFLGVGGDPRRGGGQDRGELAAIPQPPLELLLQRAAEIVADGADAMVLPRGRELTRRRTGRSEEHTHDRQSIMRISYAVFCMTQTTSNVP